MLTLIGELLKFLNLFLGEYFTARKTAQEQQRKFDVSQALVRELMARAVERLKEETLIDNREDPNLQDRLDEELNKKR